MRSDNDTVDSQHHAPVNRLAGTYFALGVSKVNREHRCFHLKIIHPSVK